MSVPETVLAAMRHTNETFCSEVVGKQDINGLNRVYTTNARILPPGTGIIEGREPIKAFWQGAIASLGLKSAKLTTVDAEAIETEFLKLVMPSYWSAGAKP